MNIAHLPSLLADIVLPPPPNIVPEHFEDRGFASLGFLVAAPAARRFLGRSVVNLVP